MDASEARQREKSYVAKSLAMMKFSFQRLKVRSQSQSRGRGLPLRTTAKAKSSMVNESRKAKAEAKQQNKAAKTFARALNSGAPAPHLRPIHKSAARKRGGTHCFSQQYSSTASSACPPSVCLFKFSRRRGSGTFWRQNRRRERGEKMIVLLVDKSTLALLRHRLSWRQRESKQSTTFTKVQECLFY